MADYAMVFEAFPSSARSSDGAPTVQESFSVPYPLGLSQCRAVGYYRYWVNKVWDAAGGRWVLWESEGSPDANGSGFPDPYGSGWASVSGSYRAWPSATVHGNDLANPRYPEDVNYG